MHSKNKRDTITDEMHMNKILFIFLICFSFPAFALDIEAVRFGQHPDKTRIVIETSDTFEFRSFTLSNPNRLIIDLPLFVWQAGDVSAAGTRYITGVRNAVNKPGISRIVFDLRQAKQIKSAFRLSPNSSGNHRLVIDLVSGTPTKAVFGNLDIDDIPVGLQQANLTNPAPVNIPTKKPVREKPLIVIDPGHGGNDPGAISPQKFYEKHIVLMLSKELKQKLEATGRYRVRLTRDDDRYIKLGQRVRLSREWDADMFISMHADSIGDGNVRGASVYTLSNTASDKQTAKLAQRENRADIIAGVDLSHEDKDVSNILIDLAMRDTMNQSRFFASLLVDSFKQKDVRILPNTHRYAGFAVLKAPDVPSVLIEAGFLSNRYEAAALKENAYRQKIITAITHGIETYFDKTTG